MADISTADVSNARQHTPNLSRLINSTKGKMKICGLDFGVNCPFNTDNREQNQNVSDSNSLFKFNNSARDTHTHTHTHNGAG